ncbi:hypothetical protein NQ318_017563 [Aromia moschata]|uniref:Uncharacterized protein n=1 Tax=Aromia moschata TaxID=1265417 RepID=A0AAV8Z1F8_9CUCU|nr:hypothetical protein NQ318_017563 [Aromia moschata]
MNEAGLKEFVGFECVHKLTLNVCWTEEIEKHTSPKQLLIIFLPEKAVATYKIYHTRVYYEIAIQEKGKEVRSELKDEVRLNCHKYWASPIQWMAPPLFDGKNGIGHYSQIDTVLDESVHVETGKIPCQLSDITEKRQSTRNILRSTYKYFLILLPSGLICITAVLPGPVSKLKLHSMSNPTTIKSSVFFALSLRKKTTI